jgi:ABC-type bacteriocin/lantibiotic exporter with double-glycine peptidase domain
MVLAYYGQQRSQTDLAKAIGIIPNVGVSASKVLRLASRRLAISRQMGDKDDLLSSLAQGIPPILEVNTNQLPYWAQDTYHVVLVGAIDQDTALIHDPAFDDPKTIRFDELQLAWDEMSNFYTIIQPK